MTKKFTPVANRPEERIAVFQEQAIRRTWQGNEWWFSVVDVCAVLTDSPDAGAYWRKLKQRLVAEGREVVTFCHGLKLTAPDGKQRETDKSGLQVADKSYRAGLKRLPAKIARNQLLHDLQQLAYLEPLQKMQRLA